MFAHNDRAAGTCLEATQIPTEPNWPLLKISF